LTTPARAALAIYRTLNAQDVDDDLLADAAGFFASTESPVSPGLFYAWFSQLRLTLTQQPELLALAKKWSTPNADRDDFTDTEAEAFHREFNAALKLDKLGNRALVCGHAERRRDGPFDYELSHYHQPLGWVLVYITGGRARLRTGVRETALETGDALLFTADALYSLDRAADCDSWSHYWVSFQPMSLWSRYLRWPAIGPGAHWLQVPEEKRETLRNSLDKLLHVTSTDSPYKVELEANVMEHTLLLFAELLDPASSVSVDSRIVRAQQYIEQNYNREFSLQQVADKVHISTSRLSSLFKSETGQSVFSYRDELRLIEAARLLRFTDLTIAQVGRRVGIQDAAYFSRLFRHYIGASPRSYRQGGGPNSL
jgi:AraC family transcriptional regulator of arabinose operon